MDKQFMINLKWQTPKGYQASLTVTADALEELHHLTCEAIKVFNAGESAPAPSKAQTNGHAPAKPVPSHREHFCEKHQVYFERHEGDNGRAWYSHPDDDNGKWCREPKAKASK